MEFSPPASVERISQVGGENSIRRQLELPSPVSQVGGENSIRRQKGMANRWSAERTVRLRSLRRSIRRQLGLPSPKPQPSPFSLLLHNLPRKRHPIFPDSFDSIDPTWKSA